MFRLVDGAGPEDPEDPVSNVPEERPEPTVEVEIAEHQSSHVVIGLLGEDGALRSAAQITIESNSAADEKTPPGSPSFSNTRSSESEGSEDTGDKSTSSRKKSSRAKKPSYVKRPASFISNVDQRTQTARRTGNALQSMVRDFTIKTGARAYFQAEYRGPNKTSTFQQGNYWPLDSTAVKTPQFLTPTKIKAAVSEAVKTTLQPFVREFASPPPPSVPGSSGSVVSDFSPRKHQQGLHKPRSCYLCLKKEVVKEFMTYRSERIGCCGDGKVSCSKWAHADCLGFPGATGADIGKMPDHYCPDHMSLGRMIKNVEHQYESEGSSTGPAKAPAEEPPKKRGRPKKN